MIRIQNIYHMLAYAFRVLNEDGYAHLGSEEFNNTADLLGAILAKGIINQVKRGLGKDYCVFNESLSTPRGKIDMSSSIKYCTTTKKQLICEFDEYTTNSYLNQILKTTALLLMRSDEVNVEQRQLLKKAMLYFQGVATTDINRIDWSRIRYHRNNLTYKMLINICYLVINGLLLNKQEGSRKLATYLDDQNMHRLYEKFVLEYYRKHFQEFNASPTHISWNTDDGIIEFLPAMKSDITLQHKGKTLIIDTKYYTHTMQYNSLFNNTTVHSHNMYQIFTYVKNKDVRADGSVAGVLLYAKTDEEVTPDFEYLIGGNRISVKTLDLSHNFNKIAEKLNELTRLLQ